MMTSNLSSTVTRKHELSYGSNGCMKNVRTEHSGESYDIDAIFSDEPGPETLSDGWRL